MDIKITKDADYLICLIYKDYKDKICNGTAKARARWLGSSEYIFNSFGGDWNFEDLDETCRELDRAGLIKCNYASNVVDDAFLTDNAIIYMENRFESNVKKVMEYIAEIKRLIF